jgi:aryl-alcohol dehydrogenase-like predicted oxidoreductase
MAAAPAEGAGLNPLLRHPSMMIHPPMLYSGYTLFAIPFAFAVGALIRRRVDADWIAATRGWPRFISAQNEYNLLDRRVEAELVPACEHFGLGVLPFFPLANGLLTGKYLAGEATAGARLSRDDAWGAKHFTAAADQAVRALADLAGQCGTSLTALSLAWTLQRPGVASVVLGPRTISQLEDQLAALEVALDEDVLTEIDRIVPPGEVVVPYYLDDDFADFRPQPYHW